MFQLDYRFTRGQASFSYVYSKSQGSVDAGDGQYAGTDFDFYPDNFVNRFGYLPDDARNRFKLYGYYRIPWIETDLSPPTPTGAPSPTTSRRRVPTASTPSSSIPGVEPHDREAQPRPGAKEGDPDHPPVLRHPDLLGPERLQRRDAQYLRHIRRVATTLRQPTAWDRPRSYQVGFRMDWY